MTDREDCSHGTFERVLDLNSLYECTDCGGRITIPRFRWVPKDDD